MFAADISPTQRVAAAEKNLEGKTFTATATMTVDKDGNTRTMKMKTWWKNRKLALVKILEPKKDHGTGNLRIDLDLWQYLPKVNRIVRIPSSMMLQSWMGSDFSNDDLVRGGSLANDYTHQLLSRETLNGAPTEKIACTPKPNTPIVWGKIVIWIQTIDNAPIKQEFYNEKGELIKTLIGTNIKRFGTHSIPTHLRMQHAKKENSSTEIEYDPKTIVFDKDIPDSVFTQENLRKN